MVKNSRKKTGPSPIRALNLPGLVNVEVDHRQRPISIILGGLTLKVAAIDDVWEIVDEWWRTRPISRRYYKVAVENGLAITIFQDLVSGFWHEQRA